MKCLERFKQQRCDRRRIYDFEDLLTETLENERKIPVSLLIVDEAQDLSSLMFQIIEMWADNAERIVLAGDPYQAIYEFQGASPKLMLNWKADREITLDRSFRCPSQIHSAARKIVHQMKDRYAGDDFFPTESGGFVTRDDYSFGKEWEKGETVFLLCRDNRQVYKRSRTLIDKCIPFGYIGKRKNMLNSKGAQMASLLTRLHSGKAVSPAGKLSTRSVENGLQDTRRGQSGEVIISASYTQNLSTSTTSCTNTKTRRPILPCFRLCSVESDQDL